MTTNYVSNATSWSGNWDDGPLDDWYLPIYDPYAPVDTFRPRLELAIVCIAYGIACKTTRSSSTHVLYISYPFEIKTLIMDTL